MRGPGQYLRAGSSSRRQAAGQSSLGKEKRFGLFRPTQGSCLVILPSFIYPSNPIPTHLSTYHSPSIYPSIHTSTYHSPSIHPSTYTPTIPHPSSHSSPVCPPIYPSFIHHSSLYHLITHRLPHLNFLKTFDFAHFYTLAPRAVLAHSRCLLNIQ